MSQQDVNYEKPEAELEDSTTPLKIPTLVKVLVGLISFILIVICLWLFAEYIANPTGSASPKELELTTILLFSIMALIVVLVPWEKLGIRITKIGGIEFKDIVREQATEHAEEISYLEDRIEALEAKVRSTDELAEFSEGFKEPELRKQLIAFLTKYREWAFSPSRIRVWGSKQQGFSALSNFDHIFIRRTLQKLVSEGLLETRISKKGNTLYRIPLA